MSAFAPSRERTARKSLPLPAIGGGALLWWGLAGAALVLGAMRACQDNACSPPLFDRRVLETLHAWRHPVLDGLLTSATWLGSIAVLLPVSLLVAWGFWRDHNPAAAILLPLSVAGAWLIAHATKWLVARPRPDLFPSLVGMPSDLSFPSAHAMQFTAFAVALVLAPDLRRVPAIVVGAILLVTLVALSRLYLQVHFPSDVLAGVVAGACWVAGLRLVVSARA
jgi:membrane-associated phospholipid phosphatase